MAEMTSDSADLRFAVIGLEHVHAGIMVEGLMRAGAILTAVHDPDPAKVAAFRTRFPMAEVKSEEASILDDPTIGLIVSASVPNLRGPLSLRALRSGKDFLAAKPAFTTLSQLREARKITAETGRKFFIFYSERIHVRSSLMAGEIISSGRLGDIVQILCLAPHRLSKESRAPWFFDPERSGGILCDIGSHQFEQILTYGSMNGGIITHALTKNCRVPGYPSFEDFGEATMTGNNGVTGYVRVDWLTPDGLGVWGDVRTVILGTKGTLEIRKYTDIAREQSGDHLYLVDATGEHHLQPDPGMPLPYFGNVIRDCLERTESSMSQEHAFLAMELALTAQAMAQENRK